MSHNLYIGAINIRLSLQIWLGWRRFVSHVSYKIHYLMEQPTHNALFNTASGVVCARRLKETKLMAINEINLFIFECYFYTSSYLFGECSYFIFFKNG